MEPILDNPTPSLFALLSRRAHETPERRAFDELGDGERVTQSVTYGELDCWARAIAATLQELRTAGETAILFVESGIDFTAAFFGCQYAGVTAVPMHTPTAAGKHRWAEKLRAILEDADPQVVLTSSNLLPDLREALGDHLRLGPRRWIEVDRVDRRVAETWRERSVSSDSIAYLQYTSGSTSTPKGVMVSHDNVLQNARDIAASGQHGADALVVSWLPLFHDLGLVSGIVVPVLVGAPCVLMPPVAFLQRPERWLVAISRFRGTHTGVPNFALELTARRVAAEARAALDLSSLAWMILGGEPNRPSSFKLFAETFASCGFRENAFAPGYGLAESTLKVTVLPRGRVASMPSFDRKELENLRIVPVPHETENATRLIGTGEPMTGTKLAIVDPESGRRCEPDRVGEIWVQSDSVARGYWNRPDATRETFGATLEAEGGTYLRTGDLGFLWRGELFVAARLKDLIIVHGTNHYPQDLEWSADGSHPSVRRGCCAAFTVEVDGEERVVAVAEIDLARAGYGASSDSVEAARAGSVGLAPKIAEAIRAAVSRDHQLDLHDVVLVAPQSVPKTSSGKIQRRTCREMYLDGRFIRIE